MDSPATSSLMQVPSSPPITYLHFPEPSTISPSGFCLSESRPYKCTVPGCQLQFKRKFTLAEHRQTHTGEKPFECPVKSCGKTFTTTGNLSRHQRLHPWLKPQTCLIIGCGRMFANESRFERHMKKHFRSPNPRETCPMHNCTKTFTTTGNLTRHLRHQHGVTRAEALKTKAVVHDVEKEIAQVLEAFAEFDCEEPTAASAMKLRVAHGYDPLLQESSDVKDHELAELLECLF